jgi:hypothetical protein
VGLGQLLQQRLGPRPATAVEEELHGQACYVGALGPAHILTTAAPSSSGKAASSRTMPSTTASPWRDGFVGRLTTQFHESKGAGDLA